MADLTLREARCLFSVAIAELILYANSLGFELALAEGMDRRTEKDPTSDHMHASNHDIGLAQDLDLYIEGVYMTDTESHTHLGIWWEEYGIMHGIPLVWGGSFKKPDGNHYSMRWRGVA